MRPRRVAALVAGALLAVLALGVLAAGAALVVAHTTQRTDGWYTTGTDLVRSDGHAVTSEEIHLRAGPGEREWVRWHDWATARVRARAVGEGAVFLGIGRADDVAGYLEGVAHDTIVDVGHWADDVTYRTVEGDLAPGPPGEQAFWEATATGTGQQELRWEPQPGDWTVVLMRADGGPGVEALASAGLRTDIVLPIGLGLLAAAVLLGGVAALLLAHGARPAVAGAAGAADGPVPTGALPVVVEASLDEPLSRWLWLVKWLLALPHLLVLAVLWPVFVVLTAVAGVAILLTGRYPRSLFELNVGIMRWTWRVTAYAFALTTDRYPPFSLAAAADHPAQLHVEHPERLSRGLVLVKWWLLALPHYLVLALIVGWVWDGGPAPWGVAGLLAIVAGVVLLATGRYPAPVFDVVVGLHRWVWRVVAYAALMRDEYPPFRLDSGGAEPAPEPAAPGPSPEPDAATDRQLVGSPR
jgi:hypothetical protein